MKKNEFTVETLMCNLVHNWHEVRFIYAVKNPDTDEWDDVKVCDWNDKYYKEHREEMYKQIVDFVEVTDKEINVFLRK